TLRPIAEGVENSNYMLATDVSRYVLTLYEQRVAVDDLPFFLDLLRHLAGKGLPVPEPIADRRGALFRFLKNKPAALTRFLPGRPAEAITVEHCQAVGMALANLHQAGADF